MKKLITFIFLLFTFIFCFGLQGRCENTYTISSVTFDNSASTLVLNTFDNDEYNFKIEPKRTVAAEQNTVYFDFEHFTLSNSVIKNLALTSAPISEINLHQTSSTPPVVRLAIKYNSGFNPDNIVVKRINNTVYLQIQTPKLQNFYFQHAYSDEIDTIAKLLEPIAIQTPVLAQQSIINQINSAFTTNDKNYVYTKKFLQLPSRYYLDNIDVKNNEITLTGIGSYTIVKPFILSEPDRLVYDIPNAVLNPLLRNKEMQINKTDTVKAGQFTENTVRVVITTSNTQNYRPIFSSDMQKLIFAPENHTTHNISKSALNSLQDETSDTKTHSVKIIFTKPVLYSVNRTDKALNVILYNVNKVHNENILTLFQGLKTEPTQNGGTKITFPVDNSAIVNVHTGTDGKTMRVRLKSENINLPKIENPNIKLSDILPVRPDGKKIIVIDAGHGGTDCGAIRSNINEKDITIDISKRVEKLLNKKGYNVYMTRYGDESVSLQERVEISENVMPDVFVSIHVNSSNNSTPNGIETHYYKDNSLSLAKTVHASMLNHITANNRGLFKSKFYVINHTTAPAILVEIGFLSNDAERAQIVTESRKQATAKAIAEGIHEYLK